MTVSLDQTRYVYAGNGITIDFPFPVPFLDAADLEVRLLDMGSLAASTPALNGGGYYDYTVIGTKDPESGQYEDGATVRLNHALAANYLIFVWRHEPLTQGVDLVDAFKFPASVVNTALDKLTMIAQYLEDMALRSVRAPWSDLPPPSDVPMELPAIGSRAGAIMGFDAAGRPAVGGNLDTLIALLAGGWTPSLSAIDWTPSITGLRALTPPGGFALVALAGYYNAGDKATVVYGYSTADSRADDGGLVIKPNSVSGGSPGRWLLLTGGRPFNVQDWGADPGFSLAGDSAFANWFAACKANNAAGTMPAGHYKFAAPAVWDLSAVATTGVKITGDGAQRTILDFTLMVGSAPCLLIGGAGSIDLFFSAFRDFAVKGNLAGVVLMVGHETYADPLNSCIFAGINVNNLSASASAVAVELNYVLNSDIYMVANCAGNGDALRCRQAVFNQIGGSFSTADIGIHFQDGYNFGNVFLAVDLEVVDTCVQSDSANASKNTWVGGQFVWTGSAALTLNAGSNYFRFLHPNFGVGGTKVTGAAAAIALIDNESIGAFVFGQVIVNPAAGDADLVANAIAGQSAAVLLQKAGSQRWAVQKNNAAEGGADAGSDLIVTRYHDDGTVIDNPLAINRATGQVTVLKDLSHAGTKLGLFGHGTATQRTITGSRGGATVAVLADLLTALDAYGLIVNNTSA